jgi:hypothetical protein
MEWKSWLAFWFPLRSRAQADDSEEIQDWIRPTFPGDDPTFYDTLCSDFLSLAPSLVSLRNLEQIHLVSRYSAASHPVTLKFPHTAGRISPPDAQSGVGKVDGRMDIELETGHITSYLYRGLSGRLDDEEVSHLKAASDWPRVVQRKRGQKSESYGQITSRKKRPVFNTFAHIPTRKVPSLST